MYALMIGLGLLAGTPESTADAFIRQALDCEAKGNDAESKRLLELAVQADPTSARARGLLGQVKVDGHWQNPAETAGRERLDQERAAIFAQYETRRAETPNSAPAQWKLALWCEEHALHAESIAPPDAGYPP